MVNNDHGTIGRGEGAATGGRRRFLRAAGASAGLVGLAGCLGSVGGGGGGGSFPDRHLTFINPYQAGGAGDVRLRMAGELIKREYGTDVVVENIVGAGTLRAMGELLNRTADGHTIAQAFLPSTVVTTMTQEPGWKLTEFTGVMRNSFYQTCVMVHEDHGFEDFEDLFASYRDGDLSKVGGLGRGHSWHLQFAVLRDRYGFEWDTFVNYDEGPSAIVKAVSQGEIGAGLNAVRLAAPLHHNEESPIQVLGTTASERHEIFEEFPAWSEDFGYDSIDFIAKFTNPMVGPPGIPDENLETLQEMLRFAWEHDEMQAFAEEQGLVIGYLADGEQVEADIATAYEMIDENVNFESIEF